MPDVVSHAQSHRPHWVGGSDPSPPIGFYEYKMYLDVGHPYALATPALAVVVAGEGQWIIGIPADLDGCRLVRCHAYNTTPGAVTVQLRRIRPSVADALMLSTPLTVDAGDLSSYDADDPYVINPATSLVYMGDQVSTDIVVTDGDACGLGVGFVIA